MGPMKPIVQWDEVVRWSPLPPEQLIPAFISILLREETPGIARECLLAQLRYVEAGEQAFVIGPELREMFVRTGLDNVRMDDIKMPYGAFWVALPDCEWEILAGPKDKHPLAGFYVTFSKEAVRFYDGTKLPEQPVIRILAWGKRPETAFGDDGLQAAHLAFDECDRMGIEPYLEYTLRRHHPTWDNAGREEAVPDDRVGEMAPVLEKCVRVLINMLLFLNSPASETEETEDSKERRERRELLLKQAQARKGKKAEKAAAQSRRIHQSTVIWVGRSVERSAGTGTGTSPGRHWVRGHWHRYRVGKGRVETVLKWIQPFLRGGTDDDPVHPRKYGVRDGRSPAKQG